MAWKMSWVRTRSGPPNFSNTYGPRPARFFARGFQLESKPILSMGSHGYHVDFVAAHCQTTSFNELARLGTVGTDFHACCLLETTTNFS